MHRGKHPNAQISPTPFIKLALNLKNCDNQKDIFGWQTEYLTYIARIKICAKIIVFEWLTYSGVE